MQASERPVFRQDLVAEAVEEQGARYIDVADPDSGHMFRFFEVEYAIACAMDGQRDVAGIVKWAQEELGLTPSPKEVQTVIATLADLRFIETGATRLSDVPEAKAAAKHADAEATTVGAAAYSDDELGRGIVVGKPAAAAASSGMNVELGNAGGAAARGAEPALPKADFDLGAPGAGAAAAASKKPAASTEDFALGAPGAAQAKAAKPAADLSLDLTADMPVTAAGVKEAVRQSKVMTAVEIPKDLQDELDGKPSAADKAAAEKAAAAKAAEEKAAAEKAAAAKAAEEKAAAEKKAAADKKAAEEKAAAEKKAAEKKAADKKTDKAADKKADKAADKAADKKADKAADKAADKKAITLPKTPPEKTPVAPPAPKQGVSPVLVVLLILAFVGAGAYFFWKFVLDKPEATEQTKAPPPKPAPPPPPAEATAKVTLETPAPLEIKSPAGTIETIEAADKDLRAGDTIATLVGAKALTTELDKVRADIDKATPQLEAANKELSDAQQKENNEAGVKAAQAKLDRVKKPLDDKKATVVKKQADLDKLVIKTTIDGKLALPTPAPKAGDKVTADQVIAAVVKPTVPVATFKIPPGTKVGADGNLSLNAGGKTVVCTVSDAQAETIKVTCPADSGLANGADVKFTLPK